MTQTFLEVQVIDIVTRLMSKIKIDEETGCWLWQPGVGSHGYGSISWNGKQFLTHRLSFMLFRGEIPYRHDICHTCDTRRCCYPLHLFSGTRLVNVRDAVAKGRNAHGSRAASAKLTEDDVRMMLAMYAGGARSDDLARQFGVHENSVTRIVSGHGWNKVDRSGITTRKTGIPKGSRVGSKATRAKLNEESVRQIRIAYTSGENAQDIATRFGTSKTNVYGICSRRLWSHVE